jgi:tetratricopeptide (TPR) repeat protein
VKLGSLYGTQGKYERATAELQQAQKLDPNSVAITSALVQTYILQKNYAPAVALLEKQAEKTPANAFAYTMLGQVHLAQKNVAKADESFQKAILAYEKILERQPNLLIGNDLAYLLCEYGRKPGDIDRALTLAQNSLAAFPEDPALMDTLGWIHYKKGDTAKAMDLLAKAQARSAENPVINYHLGMVLYKAGKTADAKEQLQKALKVGAGYPGREEAAKILQGMK